MLKKIFIAASILLTSLMGVGLVSGYGLIFPPELGGSGVLAPIYHGNEKLDSTIVVYNSSSNIESYEVVSKSCSITSQFLDSDRDKDLYFFGIDFSADPDCEDTAIFLSYKGDIVPDSQKSVIFGSFHQDKNILLDYASKDLRNYRKDLKTDIKRYGIYASYQGMRVAEYYKYFLRQRRYFEAYEKMVVVEDILQKREQKYSSPVVGKNIPTSFTKIPNSPRPYRASYTDGIHHGWDIDTDFRESTVALDDGLIVRVVDGFDNTSDFSRIEYGANLSEEQKAKNLDILRGNQVWLKTMKGEVVFYSHLDTISGNIREGEWVMRGQEIGTVGVTGVPGDNYDDYHIHFPIMENPYIRDLAGTYDFGDYMMWDWLTKGMDYKQTLEAQKNIFE